MAGASSGGRVRETSLLVLLNAWWEQLGFALPDGRWPPLLDSADANAAAGSRAYTSGDRVPVAGRALVVLGR